MKRVFLTTLISSFFLSSCASTADRSQTISPSEQQQQEIRNLHLTEDQIAQIELTTAIVERRVLPVQLELSGEIEEQEYHTTPVISPVAGRVQNVKVQSGNFVSKGELLATIRSDEVAKIESELLEKILALSADIDQAEVRLAVAEKKYKRLNRLFGEGISSRSTFEEAQGKFDEARIEFHSLQSKKKSAIATAAERLRLFGIAGSEIDRLLKTNVVDNVLIIVAPRQGTIVARNADIGQVVDTTQHLFVVSDLSKVWMFAQVFEKDVRLVSADMPVTVIVDSFPEHKFHGVVDYIGTTLDQKTRTLPVRATVDNYKRMLHPNMFGKMHLRTANKDALVVPSGAVQKTGESDLAYVRIEPNTFQERKIEIGDNLGAFIEVKSGLSPGETVVVNGSLQLEGLAVKQASE